MTLPTLPTLPTTPNPPGAPPGPAEAAALVRAAQRVIVITHINPDGDAIGSLLALGALLARLGKSAVLVCDDGVPSTYAFLPGARQVVRKVDAAAEADLVIVVDCADFARGGQAVVAAAQPGRMLLNIDHHVTNTLFGTLNWVDPASASSAQLVLDLAGMLGLDLDRELADCLMTGLVTDTQGFSTSGVDARALADGARLSAAGASAADIYERTLYRRSFRALCLWSKALADMHLEPGGVLWTHVTRAMRAACGIPEGGDSNLANFLLSAEEACMTAVFIERADGRVEISFRAMPGYNVAVVAKALGGGGHPPAAGCMVPGPLAEVEPRVVAALVEALAAQRAARQAQAEAGSQPGA